MTDWLEALSELDATGTPHVLVTQIETLGSTPRETGAKMVVTHDALFGSIGGGSLEFQAAADARGMLTEGQRGPKIEKNILGPDMRQCCGGATTLIFEPFYPSAVTLALFGAGHVAKALVRILDGVSIRVLWFDEREGIFPATVPHGVQTISVDDPKTAIARIPAHAHVLVMTHSHERDFQLIRALIQRDDLATIGMIGSASKWGQFRHRLSKEGIAGEKTASVRCPIGLPGLKGKKPAEIAIAIAAQLLFDTTETP
jgi:xanthine dehydrogenase accessory factor